MTADLDDASASTGTVDRTEIARFDALAARWWDPDGPMAPLHAMNPVRVGYIRDRLCARFDRRPGALDALAGLDLVDVGCGAGLLCEPLARLGARVTGIDAGEEMVAAARRHAEAGGLAIDYRATTAEALAATGARYDGVLALEIVEHVANVDDFLAALATLVRPGGVVVLSTLNRTARSFAMAIVGAEYVLRLLPRGTHDWRRFLRPSELAGGLRRNGLAPVDATGMVRDPLSGTWSLSDRDLAVNYLMSAVPATDRSA
ncbi:MAG: bifunctional 2-polyprenyl-6-hydroxyphenol methylase/3-demethylubiquinol 3-O-methyltransferase UbiG [Azospirillaceae bacterium]